MSKTLTVVLERPIDEAAPPTPASTLAAVVEYVPVLSALLDFYAADPIDIAQQVGMVAPDDEDDLAELRDIEFDPGEWYEASVGVASVRKAITALTEDPDILSRALYDPSLTQQQVLEELTEIERALLEAQQHERRFHFKLTE